MKSFLVIGMGNFGHHLTQELLKTKCEIMVVDKDEENLDDMVNLGISVRIADCSVKETLATLAVDTFDCCFVCMSGNFQYSLQITDLLKELGARKIYAKAESVVQEKFLRRAGADYIIYPERDEARRIAVSEHSDRVFDFIPLADEYSIYEITASEKWIGKSVGSLNFRAAYDLNIVAIKKESKVMPVPGPHYVFEETDRLYVIGSAEAVEKVIRRK